MTGLPKYRKKEKWSSVGKNKSMNAEGKWYILFFQVHCPEHWTHVQSGLYPDEILGDNKFRLCCDYLGATFNYGSGMSKLDAYCVYYLTLKTMLKTRVILTVKAAIVDDALTIPFSCCPAIYCTASCYRLGIRLTASWHALCVRQKKRITYLIYNIYAI